MSIDQLERETFDIRPGKKKVKVFGALPPADAATFKLAIPLEDATKTLRRIVLFAPNLQDVGYLDNTGSDASSSYSKAVTTGFTFTTSVTLGVETSIEATIEVVKGSVKVSMSMTFTQSWSKSTTETMTFTVPAGKSAYTYQGYMLAKIITCDTQHEKYAYEHETARCLTNVLKTSHVPAIAN